MASIYGLEMSFLATRSGLTRARIYNATRRTEKLVATFLQRHNRAVDESWYARTVDWNIRFNESATIISAPYNAYIRLVAKLRQRITQRHPAPNDTRANCDPQLDNGAQSEEASSAAPPVASSSPTNSESISVSDPSTISSSSANLQIQNDEPSTPASETNEGDDDSAELATSAGHIDYSTFSSFELLDMLADSNVHISATRSIIVSRSSKQRSPVAVSGLLYDYATFARRFLNSTSIRLSQLEGQQQRVDLCAGGQCPTRCGERNDSIDCLLLDNNGFIVVGEELAHIGRSLVDYDENLMQALVERRVYHKIQISDYQAICARSEPNDQPRANQSPAPASTSSALFASPASASRWPREPHLLGLDVVKALAQNSLAIFSWVYTMASGGLMLSQLQGQVEAQSAAVANQALLATLPNKTYLRACERTLSLYETRPSDPAKLLSDRPNFYTTRCGCSGWFVHDQVPDTNLILLIVNTSSSCRRCELNNPSNNVIPVPTIPLDSASVSSASGLPVNRTAEDQVCAMLEREAQLYPKRPENCYSHHPDEAQISICGGASKPHQVNPVLIYFTALLAILSISSSIMPM